jgi:phosphoglycerate dehydrogenase-like enzyme
MQVMMSARSHARLSARGAKALEGLEIITLDADGRIDGPPDADPEIYWVNLDTIADRTFRPMLERAAKGARARWVQTCAAGLDGPAFKAVMARGVRLCKSDAQAPPIAEYVMAHGLSLLHPIGEQGRAQTERAWRHVPFREIAASRWLLVGYGSIGKEIARRLAPFGAALDVIRRSPAPEPGVARIGSLEALAGFAAEADVVVLACPLNDETRRLADAAFFAALKPGCVLINIGRGELIDDEALKAGLERGQPRIAVLDVFAVEPLPAEDWRWAHPQVRVTAHTSFAGDGVNARGDDLFLDNLERYLAGRPLRLEAAPWEVGLQTGSGEQPTGGDGHGS